MNSSVETLSDPNYLVLWQLGIQIYSKHAGIVVVCTNRDPHMDPKKLLIMGTSKRGTPTVAEISLQSANSITLDPEQLRPFEARPI